MTNAPPLLRRGIGSFMVCRAGGTAPADPASIPELLVSCIRPSTTTVIARRAQPDAAISWYCVPFRTRFQEIATP